MKHGSAQEFLAHVAQRNPGQPEYLQAVTEVIQSLWPFIADHPKYQTQALLERRLHRRPSPRDTAWLAGL